MTSHKFQTQLVDLVVVFIESLVCCVALQNLPYLLIFFALNFFLLQFWSERVAS